MTRGLDLPGLRSKASLIILSLLWAHVPLVLVACLVLSKAWLGPSIGALACALVVHGLARLKLQGSVPRAMSGVGLVISVSLIVAVFEGQKLQVDLHMYYFAALAVLVAACDWRVIAAAAATIALHHLMLNVLFPYLIYAGGSDWLRFALHAVILIIEAASLIWISLNLESMFVSLGNEVEETQKAQRLAQDAEQARVKTAQTAEAERTGNDAEREIASNQQAFVVESVATGLATLAAGDLIFRLNTAFAPEYETLRRDFNEAMAKLQDTMTVIAANTRGIRGGGEEISQGADDLSRRTEQQAASLEETAAALDEITATVRRTAEGAYEASRVVGAARVDAEHCGAVVRQAVQAMSAISTSSVQIGDIIGLIDEIAFQTNLLALNAGVEAARAGDAGRGFAVVASEVRALAQRSAKAAKQIKTLIFASSQQVTTGVDLVGETGKALERIVEQVSQINGVVTEIAASAQEQSNGLGQVNTAINQMDQVTQQNAAMVEQSTAASHALAREAEELARLVAQFKVGNEVDAVIRYVPTQKAEPLVQSARTHIQRNAVLRPQTVLKTTGQGRAALASSAAPVDDHWEDF